MKRSPIQRKTPLRSASAPGRKPMQRKAKTKKQDCRFRSEAYLQFVRALPCCICGATTGVAAHHMIGMYQLSGAGLKAPDSYAMPACDPIYGHIRDCHQQIHANKTLRDQQPDYVRATIRAALLEFTGETREALTHALAFIESKEKA